MLRITVDCAPLPEKNMSPNPRFGILLFTLCFAPAAILAADPPAPKLVYPEARRSDQVDTYFGVKVADPYRWMEDIDSPESRAWVSGEQSLTRNYLDAIPGRE